MTDRPIRIGVQLGPQHASFQQTIDAVQRLEDMGVDIAFNWDHFFPLTGEPDGVHFECATQLAAWAAVTEKISIGPLVFCNSYRNPELLADMARTIDHASDGRFVFGIGSGWFERDYEEYGYEFGTVGSRLDDLADSLPRIKDRLSKLNPAPIGKMPILIGGKGERKTLRLVAEYADIWHSFVGPDELARLLEVLARHGDAVGRDVREIELSTGLSVRHNGHFDEERLEELRRLGVTLFEIGLSGDDTANGYDFARIEELLVWRDRHNG